MSLYIPDCTEVVFTEDVVDVESKDMLLANCGTFITLAIDVMLLFVCVGNEVVDGNEFEMDCCCCCC